MGSPEEHRLQRVCLCWESSPGLGTASWEGLEGDMVRLGGAGDVVRLSEPTRNLAAHLVWVSLTPCGLTHGHAYTHTCTQGHMPAPSVHPRCSRGGRVQRETAGRVGAGLRPSQDRGKGGSGLRRRPFPCLHSATGFVKTIKNKVEKSLLLSLTGSACHTASFGSPRAPSLLMLGFWQSAAGEQGLLPETCCLAPNPQEHGGVKGPG